MWVCGRRPWRRTGGPWPGTDRDAQPGGAALRHPPARPDCVSWVYGAPNPPHTDPLHPLVIHALAFTQQQEIRFADAQANVFSRNLR
jgi:hypothetical protein